MGISKVSGKWDAHTHCSSERNAEISTVTYWEKILHKLDGVIFGGIDPSDWHTQDILQQTLGAKVITSYGLHPWFIQNSAPEDRDKAWVLLQLKAQKAQAIGECGLDFALAKTKAARELQIVWCQRQVTLAARERKPLILHVVRSHNSMLDLLRQTQPLRGIVHAFAGDLPTARAYLSLGFKLSFDLRIKQSQLTALLHGLPADAWVIESDAHGPEALDFTAKRCATELGLSAEQVIEAQGKKLEPIFTGER